MKRPSSFSTRLAVLAIASVILLAGLVSAFSGPRSAFMGRAGPSLPSAAGRPSSSSLEMFFGPKDDGSPGDYVCLDCGYVFNKGPAAWAKLPDNYACPPCGSIKRRFKKVPKGSASGKVEVKGGGGGGGGFFSF